LDPLIKSPCVLSCFQWHKCKPALIRLVESIKELNALQTKREVESVPGAAISTRETGPAQQPFEQAGRCRIQVDQTGNIIDCDRHGGIAVPTQHGRAVHVPVPRRLRDGGRGRRAARPQGASSHQPTLLPRRAARTGLSHVRRGERQSAQHQHDQGQQREEPEHDTGTNPPSLRVTARRTRVLRGRRRSKSCRLNARRG
jgi:hypothetical protein